jgi:hypothetical protein
VGEPRGRSLVCRTTRRPPLELDRDVDVIDLKL